MGQISRRRFLQAIAVCSGALAVQAALVPHASGRDSEVSEDGTLFLEGEVLALDGLQHTVVINERGQAPVTLQVSSDTRIWKGGVTELNSLEFGDFSYVRALPGPDGTFEATKIWANIANLIGTVAAAETEGFQLLIDGYAREEPGSLITVRYRSGMILNDTPGLTPNLSVGQPVQALGVVEKDGTLSATRMWTPEEPFPAVIP